MEHSCEFHIEHSYEFHINPFPQFQQNIQLTAPSDQSPFRDGQTMMDRKQRHIIFYLTWILFQVYVDAR